jgi:microcystin-dependent protein
MSSPFIGQLGIFTFPYAPRGWAFAQGQLLPITQNLALFSLLGTQFGGDGSTNFALPDLRGRVPVHAGAGSFPNPGKSAGTPAVTLSRANLPSHNHVAMASSAGATQPLATNASLASALNLYRVPDNLTPCHPETVSMSGGNQPHENMAPFLALQFCIALQGTFPSKN